jgi:hypothetical protein
MQFIVHQVNEDLVLTDGCLLHYLDGTLLLQSNVLSLLDFSE